MTAQIVGSGDPVVESIAPGGAGVAVRGPRKGVFRKLMSDPFTIAAFAFLVLLALATVIAAFTLQDAANAQSSSLLQGPSLSHPLGTDEFGRDIGLRLLVGSLVTLQVAFGAAIFSCVIGTLIGLVAGYLGKWWDTVPMRGMDVLLALPEIVLALAILAILGNSTINLVIAIGIASVPVFARVVRSSVLSLRERDFVQAARAMGASKGDTMFRTILPNVLGPIIVQFVIIAAISIAVSAALGFLGLGPAAPAPSWGGMLQTAKSYVYQNPWYGIFPGVAVILTIVSLDRLGSKLRVAMGLVNEKGGKR